MRFPNAHSGVKKIFSAEILNLIAVLVLIGAAVCGVIAGMVVMNNASDIALDDAAIAGSAVSAVLLLVLTLASVVLLIVAYILQIVGVVKAMKDEPAFKIALAFIIIAAVAAVLGGIDALPATVKSISQPINTLAELCVTLFIIQGIRNLADRLNNGEMSAKGQKIFFLIAAMYLIAFVAGITAAFVVGIASILALVAYVIRFIVYILILTYLSRAKKMLA